MMVEIDLEEMHKCTKILLPKLEKRKGLFEKLWQSLISYAQFGNRDFINAMIHYIRCKEGKEKQAYLEEAKLHISDCFIQLFLLCSLYEIDIDEVIKLGEERLKNHTYQEMLLEFGDIKEVKGLVDIKKEKRKVVVRGLPAGVVDIVSGTARIVDSLDEAKEIVKEGDILVVSLTNPPWINVMSKCVAIVTDRGGITSHSAILSKSLDKVCIVGCQTATKELKSGKVYTVDGVRGVIYDDSV